MRIVFMGTPQFAIPSLDRLFGEHEIVSVVTQPDRPAGRGRETRPSQIKARAIMHGLSVITPTSLKEEGVLSYVHSIEPDLIIVAAFGQILPKQILELPRFGSLNVHASLLPRWRGAAPIQAAIYAGDNTTGVTIMHMDASLDTGPILSQHSTKILPDETGGMLAERLAILGADLLMESLEPYVKGELIPWAQNPELVTYAPMLKKADGILDFYQKSAAQLERQVRAYEPWPGSFLTLNELRLTVREASVVPGSELAPGEVGDMDYIPIIGCAEDALRLDLIQPAGRRVMSGEAFLRGTHDFVGTQLQPI